MLYGSVHKAFYILFHSDRKVLSVSGKKVFIEGWQNWQKNTHLTPHFYEIRLSALNSFQVIQSNKANINKWQWFFKLIIPVRGGHFDNSPTQQKKKYNNKTSLCHCLLAGSIHIEVLTYVTFETIRSWTNYFLKPTRTAFTQQKNLNTDELVPLTDNLLFFQVSRVVKPFYVGHLCFHSILHRCSNYWNRLVLRKLNCTQSILSMYSSTCKDRW